ncbi:hypothetical protein CASFOL_016296 [Castilleja foliolosa]|uniref:Uncharacterized protein n=1 Tax=Castilleja foliolosa TaxID=1961234 RepID=A0ABD3DGT0_9LAMI
MERTEPTLVPEWLRCSGNVAGGGASVTHSGFSSSAQSMRSKYYRSNSEKDNNSPHYLDRSSSSISRRNNSSSSNNNGSTKHPYSSFSRSRLDKDKNREREKEKSISRDMWDHDPLSSILTSSAEKTGLRRSQSLVSRKPGEPLPRRVDDSRTQKVVFEKDFPSLGAEEKQDLTGLKRVLSPGLSLLTGNPGFLSGEKWTSALAEVPPIMNSNNNGAGHQPSITQSFGMVSNSSSGVSSTVGLNMAEALSQPAARNHANTQQPDKSQRLEELAIKQSRQLIPMTPSMSKPLVPSSAEKFKNSKTGVRINETTMVSRGVHPQPISTQLSNQSRPGQIKPDSASTSHVGKFLVLKPGAKDGFSSHTVNGRVNASAQLASAQPTPTASTSLNNSVVSDIENNAAALSISSKPNVDKKSSQSLVAQSRSEFFNRMRKKASSGALTAQSSPGLGVLPTIAETSADKFKEGHADSSARVLGNGSQCNGDGYDHQENKRIPEVGDNSLSGNGSIYPDEEEAAFLRSLGWDENGGEDEGLTEDEINAFYQEYMNRRPSLELGRVSQPKSEPEA